MAQLGLDPKSAAQTRVEVCERLGMEPDPRDVEWLADGAPEGTRPS